MANELGIALQMNYLKGNQRMVVQNTLNATVSGSKYCDLIQNIATAGENVVFGDIGTPGFFMLQNLDATNYVEISFDAGSNYPIMLIAGTVSAGGGTCLIPNNGATIFARANTSSCNISVRGVTP